MSRTRSGIQATSAAHKRVVFLFPMLQTPITEIPGQPTPSVRSLHRIFQGRFLIRYRWKRPTQRALGQGRRNRVISLGTGMLRLRSRLTQGLRNRLRLWGEWMWQERLTRGRSKRLMRRTRARIPTTNRFPLQLIQPGELRIHRDWFTSLASDFFQLSLFLLPLLLDLF